MRVEIKSILFVCMGNICRSPMGEGVFKSVVANSFTTNRVFVDSAGTGSWHEGELPDARAIKTMARYDIDISDQRARALTFKDYLKFDLILAMDDDNFDFMIANAPIETQSKIHLFMDYTLGQQMPIPDPYYGKGDGFEKVYHMLVKGCEGLVAKLETK